MNGNHFKESILDHNEFTITWELVPGRGAREKNIDAIFSRTEDAVQDGRIDAITLTDNPGGNPAMSAEYMGMKVRELGIEPLVHFTCKDKSRNQMESLLYALERETVENILVVTGDYLVSGYAGRSRPVFDLDAVHTLKMVSALNRGLEFSDAYGRQVNLKETSFFAGCAVSQFKRLESELMNQYYKLEKKVEAGAQFVIPQLGYDARKIHELIQFIELKGWDIPVLGNVYILTHGAARAMNNGRIPGCVVPDRLLSEIEAEKNTKQGGREAALLRAAKMYAMMKGMGYAGVHLGGHGFDYEDVAFVIDHGEELAPNWRDFVHEFDFPQEDGFYYFRKDKESGLNLPETNERSHKPRKNLHYTFFLAAHHLFFKPESPFFPPLRKVCSLIDGSIWERPFEAFERMMKTISNNCRECGDCALFDLAYLCPMSQCPKNQRNGACGGSSDGWCEVYPGEKRCIYVRAYDRLKAYGKEEELTGYVPPVNWDLYWTSSWLNYFLGRDHHAPSGRTDERMEESSRQDF